MPHFVAIKKQIHKDIIAALDKAGELDYDLTIAQFSLNSGFTEKTIKEIAIQMIKLNYMKLENGKLTRQNLKER